MITPVLRSFLIIIILTLSCSRAVAAEGASAINDNDHIVFIGDSITGQGANGGANGWIGLFAEGLRLVRPTAHPTLTGLGGSGTTVGYWLHIEKTSRSEPLALDAKAFDVGKTLDGKVDIVVVMLGMNDVLSPSLRSTPAEFEAWIAKYRELIEAIRVRSHPRVIALATVTPCTEDPLSPKNLALAEMNERLAALAQEKDLRLVRTNTAAYELLALGRACQPDFHVTGDFVHPNGAGHLAIALGMLRGLGEEAAAAQLLAKYTALYRPKAETLPTLSYTLAKIAGSADDDLQQVTVTYQWTAAATTPTTTKSGAEPAVTLTLPHGWQAEPASLTASRGSFLLRGPLDHAQNRITLTAISGNDTRTQDIAIPAGWRIASGVGKTAGWVQNSTYDPAKGRQPIDEQLARGEGITAPVRFPTGDPAAWKLYVASNDYTGLNRSGSVDMAAVVFFAYGQETYGARWIRSERERTVNLDLGSQAFAGTSSLGVWLNGKPTYEGKLAAEPGGKLTTTATLQKGWNLLLFKSTFIQWQWQFSIELSGQAGDDLADLRYATKAPTPPTPTSR